MGNVTGRRSRRLVCSGGGGRGRRQQGGWLVERLNFFEVCFNFVSRQIAIRVDKSRDKFLNGGGRVMVEEIEREM